MPGEHRRYSIKRHDTVTVEGNRSSLAAPLIDHHAASQMLVCDKRRRISRTSQTVVRGPNLYGFGNRPVLHPAHHVDAPTGMIPGTGGFALRSPTICESRRKPFSGKTPTRVTGGLSDGTSIRLPSALFTASEIAVGLRFRAGDVLLDWPAVVLAVWRPARVLALTMSVLYRLKTDNII